MIKSGNQTGRFHPGAKGPGGRRRWFLLPVMVFFFGPVAAQQPLRLADCYDWAKANYPLIKKLDLVAKTGGYDLENAAKKFLPQVSFSGQATYQSQTISFSDVLGSLPITGSLPSISKDQYKIQGELSQLLYDGGATRYQKDLVKANTELQQQNLEAGLYAIKNRINNLFFSILLVDAQLKQNEINKDNLLTQVRKTEAALANGVAFRSNLDELKAALVNIERADAEYAANRVAYLKMLSVFIGKELAENVSLEQPVSEASVAAINRPELKAYDLQKNIYAAQEKQLRADYLPQASIFLQGAYGRPTLNIIENKFGAWYIGGLRFNWSLNALYTMPNRKKILALSRKSVDADREAFLLNTRLDSTQQNEQVKKYNSLLQIDEKEISLREAVKKAAEAQLANGVITTHEYIQQLNAEHLARQTKVLHEIQLLQAIYNQQFITGNQ